MLLSINSLAFSLVPFVGSSTISGSALISSLCNPICFLGEVPNNCCSTIVSSEPTSVSESSRISGSLSGTSGERTGGSGWGAGEVGVFAPGSEGGTAFGFGIVGADCFLGADFFF